MFLGTSASSLKNWDPTSTSHLLLSPSTIQCFVRLIYYPNHVDIEGMSAGLATRGLLCSAKSTRVEYRITWSEVSASGTSRMPFSSDMFTLGVIVFRNAIFQLLRMSRGNENQFVVRSKLLYMYMFVSVSGVWVCTQRLTFLSEKDDSRDWELGGLSPIALVPAWLPFALTPGQRMIFAWSTWIDPYRAIEQTRLSSIVYDSLMYRLSVLIMSKMKLDAIRILCIVRFYAL